MRVNYKGIPIILVLDEHCFAIESAQLPDSHVDIWPILSPECKKFCIETKEQNYMKNNPTAYL